MREYDLSAAQWYKSSYSDQNGGDCIEVARWRKSTHSDHNGGSCLEVRDDLPGLVPIRDSKDPEGPALVFPADGWTSFIGAVKSGQLTTG